jgi:hypothetical protein
MNILFFSKDLISIRATFVMADVNATVEPLQGRLAKPLGRTVTYIHGLRTKEVIAIHQLLAAMDKSLKNLLQQV